MSRSKPPRQPSLLTIIDFHNGQRYRRHGGGISAFATVRTVDDPSLTHRVSH
jgi:hypothetical protein